MKLLLAIVILTLTPYVSFSASNIQPNTAIMASAILQAEQDHPTEMTNLKGAAEATRSALKLAKDEVTNTNKANAALPPGATRTASPDLTDALAQLRSAQKNLIDATQDALAAGINSEIAKAYIKQQLEK